MCFRGAVCRRTRGRSRCAPTTACSWPGSCCLPCPGPAATGRTGADLRPGARLHQLRHAGVVPAAGRLAGPLRRGPRALGSAVTAGPGAARPWAATRSWRTSTRRSPPPGPTGPTPWSPSACPWAGGAVRLRQRMGRYRPDAVVSVSAVSRWYVRDTLVRCVGCTGSWRRPWGRRVLSRGGHPAGADQPWLTPPPLPLRAVERYRTDAVAARAW